VSGLVHEMQRGVRGVLLGAVLRCLQTAQGLLAKMHCQAECMPGLDAPPPPSCGMRPVTWSALPT
jgi:hypothetical protein